MEKKIKFGIGFVTGRANVCRIINSYYNSMIEQTKKYKNKVEITILFFLIRHISNAKEKNFIILYQRYIRI